MILQARDKEILSKLSRYGILSSAQIRDLFFKNIRHTTMMKRLRVLEMEELILRIKGLPDSMSAWSLSVSGAKAIGAEAPNRYANQNVIVHEVAVSGVRIVLESIGIGLDFTSGATLRSRYKWTPNQSDSAKRIIPDGIFVAEINGQSRVVALEVELQPKNHARLKRIFSEYAKMSTINQVFYIAGSVSIANLVIREWNKVSRYNSSPELLVCLLDELKMDFGETRVFDSKGNPRPLSQIFDSKNGVPKTSHGVSRDGAVPLSRSAA